jgi:hypothetical protein
MEDFEAGMCSLLLAAAYHVGPTRVAKSNVPALTGPCPWRKPHPLRKSVCGMRGVSSADARIGTLARLAITPA